MPAAVPAFRGRTALTITEPADTRILVVEDDDATRYVLVDVIRAFGVRVHTARDGQEALELLPSARHLRMPRVDGIDFVKRLRRLASFHRTPTVAVTSLMLPGDMAATREAGFDGHLLKPITRDMIGRVLRRAVSERPPPPNA